MSVVRPLARLAWRDVRRRPVRTLLIALLIAGPTVVILTINLVLSTTALTAQQNAVLVMGRAQQMVTLTGSETPPFPAGAVVIERRVIAAKDRSGEFHSIEVRAGNVLDPLLSGKYELLSGRAVRGPNDVMVSSEFNRKWHLGVGDQVALGADAQSFSITGIVRDRNAVRSTAVYVAADSTVGFKDWTDAYLPHKSNQSFETDQANFQYATDTTYAKVGVKERALIQLAMFVVLMLLALLISAAFASGAKRQLREVGLASSNGANPVHIRRMFALQGTFTATLGAAVGASLVGGSLLIWRDDFDRAMGRIRPVDVNLTDLLISVGAIVFAGTFAAWMPARAVSRTPVLAALAGRRPLPPAHGQTPVLGLAVMAVGGALVFTGISSSRNSSSPQGSFLTILVGLASLIVGIAISSSWIVAAVGNRFARVGGVVRLVGRSIARHRTRTGPLVAAMAATGTATIMLLTALNSEQHNRLFENPVQEFSMFGGTSAEASRLVEEILRIVPDTLVIETLNPTVVESTREFAEIRAGDNPVQIVDAQASTGLEPAVVAALLRGEAVSSDQPGSVRHSSVRVAAGITASEGPFSSERSIEVPVAEITSNRADRVMIDIATVEELGLRQDQLQASVELVFPTLWSSHQRQQLIELSHRSNRDAELVFAMTGNPNTGAWLYVYEPTDSARVYRIMTLVAVGVGSLLILIAVGFGMSLSRVEQRDEDRLLQALGASPGTRRRAGAVEAALLCGIAAAIAVPTGLALALVIRRAAHGVATDVPWLAILGFSSALPALAAAFFGPLRRSPRRIELLQ